MLVSLAEASDEANQRPVPETSAQNLSSPSATSDTEPSRAYWHAAQRLVTLEARLNPRPSPSSSSATTNATPGFSSEMYESPSPSAGWQRPSPISLPPTAVKYFRGMARAAPPNTPDSPEWAAEEDAGRSTESPGWSSWREFMRTSPDLTTYGTASSADLRDIPSPHSKTASSTASRCSTPSPTSPRTPLHPHDLGFPGLGSPELSARPPGQMLGSMHVQADDETTAYTTRETVGPTKYAQKASPRGTGPMPTRAPADLLGPLESIAAELGEMSLGYEIRHFSWIKREADVSTGGKQRTRVTGLGGAPCVPGRA